jgi:hypothetical protein
MNEDKLEYLGITAWHNAGIKGQGITIASRESLSPHGRKVLQVIEQICPAANILYQEDYKTTKADIYTTSMFSITDSNKRYVDKGKEAFINGTFLVCAVGNYEDEKQTFLSTLPFWTSIGACYLYPSGKIKKTEYSSITSDIDYMSITNWKTGSGIFTGTSCATPVFASMLVLVQEYFKEKCGRKLTNNELLKFIDKYTVDLENEGHDDRTGNGVFILPEPEKIDLKEFVGDVVELTIGSKEARINDKQVNLDTAPIIQDNRTLVPLRFIAEALNCDVLWDNERRKVFILK